MIFDKIENANLYKSINARIAKALAYIQSTNFSNLAPGKYEIEGDTIFAIISEYVTKDETNELLESHRKYIDVQYMAEGFENIGVTTFIDQQAVKSYDKENDYMLYNEPYTLTLLKQGMFAIFFPDDIHMPGISAGNMAKVKKVVIKVAL